LFFFLVGGGGAGETGGGWPPLGQHRDGGAFGFLILTKIIVMTME